MNSKLDQHIYLFILSGPYSGSTLLTKILVSSPNISCNNDKGEMEGQKLKEVAKLNSNEGRWNPEVEYDWIKIKEIYRQHWDLSKSILLEKSPPNLARAKRIAEVFVPCRFIVLTRNPYAICESLHHRSGIDYRDCPKAILKYFRFMDSVLEAFGESHLLSYEALCENTHFQMQRLIAWFPQIESLNVDLDGRTHNRYRKGTNKISNNNSLKISNIGNTELRYIHDQLKSEEALFKKFGYDITLPF